MVGDFLSSFVRTMSMHTWRGAQHRRFMFNAVHSWATAAVACRCSKIGCVRANMYVCKIKTSQTPSSFDWPEG